jgi:hypothetical protein
MDDNDNDCIKPSWPLFILGIILIVLVFVVPALRPWLDKVGW